MASQALAQKAVANVVKESKESGSEPPTAITGKGTAGSPYDGGNLPETTTQPGVEPPSGREGAGTVEDPYDQGNAPEQEQVPGGKIEHSAPTGFPEHQGSATPLAEPNAKEAQGIIVSKDLLEEKEKEAADSFKENAGATNVGGNFDAAKAGAMKEARRRISDQRDVSPGTLKDGSHARTAEDRGEVYEASKLSKFKNKLGFGKS